MEHGIINIENLSIKIYKELGQYRLLVQNGNYNENYFSDIYFNNLSDLLLELEKEILFYKKINKHLLNN